MQKRQMSTKKHSCRVPDPQKWIQKLQESLTKKDEYFWVLVRLKSQEGMIEFRSVCMDN